MGEGSEEGGIGCLSTDSDRRMFDDSLSAGLLSEKWFEEFDNCSIIVDDSITKENISTILSLM